MLWKSQIKNGTDFFLWKRLIFSTPPCGKRILVPSGFDPVFHIIFYYYLLLLYLFFLFFIKNRKIYFSFFSACGKVQEVFYEIYL